MTLKIRRSGIIQRVDHRPSVTSFWTSRFFALSIIHHDHVHLSADFPEMLLTHCLVNAEPFISLFTFTITPALSSKKMKILSFRCLDFL